MALPPIPAKRYFTIGEVSELCDVKPYVLRYWEQEFGQLRPVKRKGNRRYYQHHEILLIRKIRGLLYEQGFTINGARNKLGDSRPSIAPNELADDSAVTESEEDVLPNTELPQIGTPENQAEVADELLSLLNILRPGQNK